MSAVASSNRRDRLRRIVTWGATTYLVFTLAFWAFVYFGADEAPLPTLFVFGPRFPLAAPLVVLIPLALGVRARWAGAAILASALIVAGPLTGGAVSIGPTLGDDRPALVNLRLVTWNMGGTGGGPAFRQFVEQTDPTLIVCQEAGPGLALLAKEWTVIGAGSNQVATRLPARSDGAFDFSAFGVGGRVDRFVLETPDGDITLADVHLPTVRPGVEAALGTKGRDLTELRRIIQIRSEASRLARAWVGDAPNLIIAGDFNMPADSRIYRRDWSDLRNAFGESGNGWGLTKHTRWHGVRIDHVLYSPVWRCRRVWVGPPMGSDHRPVVTDLVLENG